MNDERWPNELSNYYASVSLGDEHRATIEQIRETALETRKWKRIAVSSIAACIALVALSAYFMINPRVDDTIVQGTEDRERIQEQVAPDTAPIGQYDLVAVRVHRDWCGKCKRMGNVFAELQQELGSQRILFLTFDLTDSETTRESLAISDRLKISQALRGIESGNIVLLDRQGNRVDTLDGESEREFLVTQIASRL